MKWYHLATLGPLALAACTEGVGPNSSDSTMPVTPAEPAALISTPSKTWVLKPRMPTARKNHVAVAVDGIVYAIGGEGGPTKVEAYIPSTNSWTSRLGLGEGRTRSSGAAAINGKIYMTGGINWSGHLTKTLLVYNPATNLWTQRADLPVASTRGASAAIGGKLYVYTPANQTTDGWPMLHRYDPASNGWVKLARPPQNVEFPAAGAMAGKLYLAGGHTPNGPSDKLHVYDPATNSWTTKHSMPTARYDAAAAVAHSGLIPTQRLYVMGGTVSSTSTTMLQTVEAYNPATDTWTTVASLHRPRRGLAAATANGIIYALGGTSSGVLRPVNEAY